MSDLYPDGCTCPHNPYRGDDESVSCPVCGEELAYNDELYIRSGDRKIVGCTHCIKMECPYD